MSENETDKTERLQKRSEWSNWIVLAVIILCFVVIIRSRPRQTQQGGAVGPGQKGKVLAQLQLQPLTGNGQPKTLADLTGKVVLLNFWGPWCPPCRQEIPHIAAIERKFNGRSAFSLLSVSCGRERTWKENLGKLRNDTNRLLDENNLTLNTYADPSGVSRKAVDKAIGFDGYPTTLVLDRLGQISGVWVGYSPGIEHEIEHRVAELLAD